MKELQYGAKVIQKYFAKIRGSIFLAFRRKNIEFSMEANFQRKVMIIRKAYCFQPRKFSNENSLETKIDFEFSCEKSLCLINDFENLSEIRSLFALLEHSHVFSGQKFAKFEFAVMIVFCHHFTMCKLYNKLLFVYITVLQDFKGSLYCLVHVKSNAALYTIILQSFLGSTRPLADTRHVFVTQTPRVLLFVSP